MPVVCTWGWMSAGLVAVTVTPGRTAPVLSVTVPLIRPRKSCAKVGAAIDSSVTHRQYTVSLFSLIIRPPTNSRVNANERARRHRGYLPTVNTGAEIPDGW